MVLYVHVCTTCCSQINYLKTINLVNINKVETYFFFFGKRWYKSYSLTASYIEGEVIAEGFYIYTVLIVNLASLEMCNHHWQLYSSKITVFQIFIIQNIEAEKTKATFFYLISLNRD